MVDRFNRMICGKWAERVKENLELFGDRDYIRRKTGRSYFGKCRIFTAVGHEFIKRMAQAQALKEVIQFSANDPVVASIRPQMYNTYFKLAGIPLQVPDKFPKAVMDATSIGTKILTMGIPDMPLPSDPHDIYVGVFDGMLKDPYWQQNVPPQNVELLYNRMMMQNQMLQQQQMAQMQQQMAMQAASAPPAKGKRVPDGAGEANQNAQGPQGSA